MGPREYSRADLEAGEVAFPDLFLSNSMAVSPPRKGDPKLRAEVGSFPLHSSPPYGPRTGEQQPLALACPAPGSLRHSGGPETLLIC